MIDFRTRLINLKKSCRKHIPELLALQARAYPDFVFKRKIDTLRGEIPIFTFHSVEPVRFERQLRFLAENDYQTLTGDEVYECISGSRPIPRRSVCLTFDDGWGSVWAVAFPLLKKYGFKAVCFLVPGLIHETKQKYPNLEDIENQHTDLKEVLDREKSCQPLCTWAEIRHMHDSGTFDFQSHGMYHSLIFTSPKIVDFMNPLYDRYRENLNVPLIRQNGLDDVREMDWGAPIYDHDSRFAGKRRYFDDEQGRRACTDYVKRNGNLIFFRRMNWRFHLIRVLKQYPKLNPKSRFESEEEMNSAIFSEFVLSKKLIEEKLSHKSVRHFGYPWWRGSALAASLSKKAGYVSNYLGIVKEKRTMNKPGDDPFCLGRLLSNEYIFRLPGQGRKSLMESILEVTGAGLRSSGKPLSAKNGATWQPTAR